MSETKLVRRISGGGFILAHPVCSFPLPFPYNNRIRITDADTGKSNAEIGIIFRILFRICTHKSI